MLRSLAALAGLLALAARADPLSAPAPETPPPAASTAPPEAPLAPAPTEPARPPPPPEPAAPPAAPAAPAAVPRVPVEPAATIGAARPRPSVELSGLLHTTVFRSSGGVAPSTDLPRSAYTASDTFGASVRQSRLGASFELPADGLLAGARLHGLAEADLLGDPGGGDLSFATPRLRHAWVSATAPGLGGLTVTIGQTWGLLGGARFAESVARVAEPRFAGAGALFRRAPQLRVGAARGGALALSADVAALAPIDPVRSAGVPAGERSGLPDVEGRVAAAWTRGDRRVAELGLSGREGELAFQLGASPGRTKTVRSWGAAADARVELPFVTLQGAAFLGQALGAQGLVAPEVKTTTDSGGALTAVSAVRTRGFWAQAVARPLPRVGLLLGYGIEDPTVDDLPATAATLATTVNRNQQTSGGVVLALASRWKVSGEVTWFVTNTQDRFRRNSTQLELASLVEF